MDNLVGTGQVCAGEVNLTIGTPQKPAQIGIYSMKMMNPVRTAIILPAYNEALTIRETIESFHRALPESYIVIVNNNSSDDTYQIAKRTIENLQCQGEVINEPRQGKGNALRRAFLDIDADVYVVSDADMTYPAGQARDLIQPVVDNVADMVVGDRRSNGRYTLENKRRFHGFGNRLVQVIINSLFGSTLVDIMSGYRVMSRRFVKNYPILVEGFQIETDLSLHALDKRFRVLEIPIDYKDRPTGSFSKLNTFSDGMRVLRLIFQIFRYYKPMHFFCGLSLFFLVSGLVAAIPVIGDWIKFSYVYHVPLAILATGCEIVAVVMLAIGLVLDSLVHLQRRAYERDIMSYSGKP